MASRCDTQAKRRKRAFQNTEDPDDTIDDDVSRPGVFRRTDRKFCPHCGEVVASKTFKLHKRLYYDQGGRVWYTLGQPLTSRDEYGDESSGDKSSGDESPPCSPVAPIEWMDPISPPSSPSSCSANHDIMDIVPTADSEPEDNECVEIWSEGEEIIDDISDSESDPETKVGSPQNAPSMALARWLLIFLMFMQAVYHLSDTVLTAFLRFFSVFLTILGRFCIVCAEVAQVFPSTLYKARKYLSIDNLNFRRYVVCKKCHQIYYLAECIEGVGSTRRSKFCSFKNFPHHPHRRMREPCGTLLLKTVEFASGKRHFYPFLTYCYLSLEVSIQSLMNRPGFFENCEHWRLRDSQEGLMSDVYDGKIWKEFQNYGGQHFLSEAGNLALMLNIDFFQPFKHVTYSLGAIYLTVMNLPRHMRNKQENILLVGLIPGPHEPAHDLNSFLEPLVEDLLHFWDGIELSIPTSSAVKKIRCALLCVACDLPAGRKVCGFLAHSARLGCSRCFKRFEGEVGSMDYSGFDRENWNLRTSSVHRQAAMKLRNVSTRSALHEGESESGCRYSVLLKLPYFDAPRMLIVDPMHNLFLGSAKHYLKAVWIELGIVSESQFDLIQCRVDNTIVPSDIGRIPCKIRSGFSSFTADQWKNWTVYYSLLVLHDILSGENLECWRHFVLACRILCCKQLTMDQVRLADALLLQFCRRAERLYGKEIVTPNMHMHCHLRACVEDYGPLHGFWLFAFERYNGILGKIPNNSLSIEVQLMNHFLADNKILSASLPEIFSDELQPFLPRHLQASGSLGDTVCTFPDHDLPLQTESASMDWTIESPNSSVKLPSHSIRKVLLPTQTDNLVELYTNLYSVSRSAVTTSSTYRQYSSAVFNAKQLGSHRTRTASSSIVLVLWDCNMFGCSESESSVSPQTIRPARINYFAKQVATINSKTHTHLLVALSWFKFHPKSSDFGKPVTVVYYDIFEPSGVHSLIPIQFVKCRAIGLLDTLDGESVLYVSPCIDF